MAFTFKALGGKPQSTRILRGFVSFSVYTMFVLCIVLVVSIRLNKLFSRMDNYIFVRGRYPCAF